MAMTKRAILRRNCRKKVRFTDEAHAVKRAVKYGLHYYRCPVCHAWHLTSGRR